MVIIEYSCLLIDIVVMRNLSICRLRCPV